MQEQAVQCTNEEVIEFLFSIKMDQYLQIFRKEEIEGSDLLSLSDKGLAQIGVKSAVHRLKIRILFKRELLGAEPSYSVGDVLNFLHTKNKFKKYAQTFKDNCIDGDLLLAATPEAFEELGVIMELHQQQIKENFKKYVSSAQS